MAFVREALHGVSARGGDPQRLLADAGIAPSLLVDLQGRVSAAAFGRLWRASALALDDELFGQDRRRLKLGSLATLGLLCVHTRTLQQALQRGTRLLNLLLDDVRLELRHDARRATVVLLPNDCPVKVFAHETLVIVLQALICWLIDRRIPLLEAQFAYPAPAWAEEYPRIYSRNIAFDAALTQFSFPVTDLRAPVVQTERTLREFLRDAPANVIVKYRNPRSLSTYLRHALKHRKHGFELSFDSAAQELGLSPSTLRRRLEAEGTSFRLIKDGARRDVAIRQLQQTRRSIPEVAESLGFAESSAFHRAFTKWMGISPGQFRQSGRSAAEDR